MVGVVVVTHGQLAVELLNAAETIVGDLPRFAAVSIGWHEDTDDAREEIAQAVAKVQQGQGVLIVTDMFGGTPSNLALTFLGDDVEVITGVNLPMLIKLASLKAQPNLLEVAREMRDHPTRKTNRVLGGGLLPPPRPECDLGRIGSSTE
jgi:PTS system mannose-specific IIA component